MRVEEAKDFCARWLPLWTGNRPQTLLQLYREDAFYRDPARPQGLKGHHELAPYLTKLLARNPDWVWEAIEVIETPGGFTLKWRATIPIGTMVVVEEGLDIVEVDSQGLISRNEVYFDRSSLMNTR